MFCGNCGNQIPDNVTQCPICGAYQQPSAPVQPEVNQPYGQTQQPYQAGGAQQSYGQPYQQGPQTYRSTQSNGGATAGLILGICGIVLSILGSVLFGIPGAVISTILSAVGMVLGITAMKKTNKQNGMPAFICGLVGLCLGVLFTIGCSAIACYECNTIGTHAYSCGVCGSLVVDRNRYFY